MGPAVRVQEEIRGQETEREKAAQAVASRRHVRHMVRASVLNTHRTHSHTYPHFFVCSLDLRIDHVFDEVVLLLSEYSRHAWSRLLTHN